MEEFNYPTSYDLPFLFIKIWRTFFRVQINSLSIVSPTSFPAKHDGRIYFIQQIIFLLL